MACAAGAAKPQIAGFTGFSRGPRACLAQGLRKLSFSLARIEARGLDLRPKASPRLYFLLCMFNGFAFARPLCGPIKVNLMGVGFTLVQGRRPVGIPGGGLAHAEIGG